MNLGSTWGQPGDKLQHPTKRGSSTLRTGRSSTVRSLSAPPAAATSASCSAAVASKKPRTRAAAALLVPAVSSSSIGAL